MSVPDPTQTRLLRDYAHESPLIACRFDPKDRFVYASAEDQAVLRWDLKSGAKTKLQAHDSWVFSLATTPDGKTLLSGGGDGRLVWWDAAAEKPAPVRTTEAHQGWVRSIAVTRDGSIVATAGNDRMVRLWSSADGQLIQELPGHDKQVYRVTFDPTGRYVVSADLQGRVIQWELATRKEARRLDAGKLYKYDTGQQVDYGGVRDLSFSPDGNYLACAGLIEASNPLGAVSNPAVVLLDWKAGTEKVLQRPKETTFYGVAWGVRYHPAGFVVAVSGGTGGGMLLFWKPDQPHEFFKLALPNTGRDLDLHPDDLRLATAHHDGKVRVYTMAPKATT